jgi:hypothetical protein
MVLKIYLVNNKSTPSILEIMSFVISDMQMNYIN